jgi:hypothetical protein
MWPREVWRRNASSGRIGPPNIVRCERFRRIGPRLVGVGRSTQWGSPTVGGHAASLRPSSSEPRSANVSGMAPATSASVTRNVVNPAPSNSRSR